MHKQHVRPKDHGRLGRRPAEQVLADVIRSVLSDVPGPLVVAVGGPGGTGKRTFAGRLTERLGDAAVLRLDDYKTPRADRQKAGIFGPHPSANKMALIAKHLGLLRQGRAVDKPIYDSSIGDARSVQTYQPARFNVIEGEVATYREFRDLVDFAIFIDSDWRTQLATRLGRDLTQRNYTLEKAIATFLHSNLREFSQHGAESKNWADVHLFCHDDYRLELESMSAELYRRVADMLHEDVEAVELAGLIVPLLTPFSAGGAVDEQAFVEHPLILCNVPHHTQNPLTPSILRRVEHFGLYDAAGDLSLIAATLRYFVGDDMRICRALQAGAIGVVSAAANALPELYVSLDACIGEHRRREAESQQESVRQMLSRLGDNRIPALKRLVQARIEGYPAAVRPPLAPIPQDQDATAAGRLSAAMANQLARFMLTEEAT